LLNKLENERPGTKLAFYVKFLEARKQGLFSQPPAGPTAKLYPCPNCGQPTSSPGLCSFCRLMERAVVVSSSHDE
jgi:hypothetical protein